MLYATIPIVDNVNANITNLGDYASKIVGLFLTIAGIAAFVYLAYGGVQWVMSGSDKTKVEEARSRITNAIIGLGIVAASWAIFLVLNHFFGLGLASGSGGNSGSDGSNNSSGSGYCGGLNVNEVGEGPGGVMYKCLPANSVCSTTGSSYPYPFNCPLK